MRDDEVAGLLGPMMDPNVQGILDFYGSKRSTYQGPMSVEPPQPFPAFGEGGPGHGYFAGQRMSNNVEDRTGTGYAADGNITPRVNAIPDMMHPSRMKGYSPPGAGLPWGHERWMLGADGKGVNPNYQSPEEYERNRYLGFAEPPQVDRDKLVAMLGEFDMEREQEVDHPLPPRRPRF
jgi:hypothetical protein